MMEMLMKPVKCPKCSGDVHPNINIHEVVSKKLEEITPEEWKKVTLEKKITSKKVEKILIEGFKLGMELQLKMVYICESCSYVLEKKE